MSDIVYDRFEMVAMTATVDQLLELRLFLNTHARLHGMTRQVSIKLDIINSYLDA